MTKRIDRLEAKLDEVIALLRVLVLRGGSPLPQEPEDDDDFTPVIPPLPMPEPMRPWQPPVFPHPTRPDPFERTTTCSRCGMEFKGLKGLMGYVCQDLQCPMGCGPVTC